MKKVYEIAEKIEGAAIIGDKDAICTSIERDSRKVKEGTLFVAIKGANFDGHDFLEDAQKKGAVAVLSENDFTPPKGMTLIKVPNLEESLKIIAPFFYDYPAKSMRVIGITGTNGKTTTSYLIRRILRENGYKVGLIGTIQIMIEEEIINTANTTPDIVELQNVLERMKEANIDYVVMEVSSHALALQRVAGIEFDTAVFTNLTQDHLDFHKTIENYRAAKAKLFKSLSENVTKPNKCAVVNIDDAAGDYMLKAANTKHITYSIDGDSAICAKNADIAFEGTNFTLTGDYGTADIKLHLTGRFNVYNALAAIGACLAENIPLENIKKALADFTRVHGRFERVGGKNISVIVDYAHTPDGVENALKTAREIAKNRVIAVFGCGGDRDKTKRPIMGKIAAKLSDIVIATSDNPRTENPESILDDVMAGVSENIGNKTVERITDRKTAIYRAVELATDGDIVAILGKGHENYQILNTGKIHFDDGEVARDALKEYGK
ncbi:MAG: UDP-N-acetylmuramoyl-L-alanyl-D-glutamate--2,6-diaminopimelate ligase [Selenomonadaceae bacterium]|nr:UDP-N-acetylmuramoyl-L-alanyl-D-glutamate--2,6-diaminopimelate ligase [Selenomonadaceae bacterium]